MSNQLSFSLPEQFGVKMFIDENEYEIYAEEGRISDYLISVFSKENNKSTKILFFDASEAEEKRSKIYISFSDNGMQIESKENVRTYAITHEEFEEAFLAHVKKYAIYFAAPANYQAIMLLPFNTMVEKMRKYEPAAQEIEKRIEIILQKK